MHNRSIRHRLGLHHTPGARSARGLGSRIASAFRMHGHRAARRTRNELTLARAVSRAAVGTAALLAAPTAFVGFTMLSG
jgi:hypothetical protein